MTKNVKWKYKNEKINREKTEKTIHENLKMNSKKNEKRILKKNKKVERQTGDSLSLQQKSTREEILIKAD